MIGGFLDRLLRGTRRAWTAERHRYALPSDLAEYINFSQIAQAVPAVR